MIRQDSGPRPSTHLRTVVLWSRMGVGRAPQGSLPQTVHDKAGDAWLIMKLHPPEESFRRGRGGSLRAQGLERSGRGRSHCVRSVVLRRSSNLRCRARSLICSIS